MDASRSDRRAVAEVRLHAEPYLVAIRIIGEQSAGGEIPVEIEGACESFRGSFEAALTPEDFWRLREAVVQLEQSVGQENSLEVETSFPAIHLRFSADRTGHLTVYVRLTAKAWVSETLAFSIPCDQTFLPAWRETLEGAIRVIRAGQLT